MRILLADDHDLFAEMVKFYLERIGKDVTVQVVPNYAQARTHALTPPGFDLILLDLFMPGMHGLSGLTRLMAEIPGVPIALVSGSTNRNDVRGALRAGAAGFIPKTLSGSALMEALETVVSGGRFLPPSIPLDDDDQGTESDKESGDGFSGLTVREAEVFQALLAGRQNKEIAIQLGIAEITVKLHLRNVFHKIGARNRGDAIRIGLTRGLIKTSATP
ncbi:MAG: response regulator transcription factor [Azospirillaceae bacterium]|nr:response regulator transcription factor [Azospirillaceae bacterium]